jgi:hypothetical protein
MTTATRHFDLIQLGEEATKGTAVPATVQIPATISIDEQESHYRSDHPRSVRATRGGVGVVTRKGMTVGIETELSPQDILWPLHTGVLGNVTPAGAGADKTWTFTPELTTSALTVDSATVELVIGDGTTNHYAREFAHGLTRSMSIRWSEEDVATLSWEMFGQASAVTTPTAALTPYSARQQLVSQMLSVYRDGTWAGLGGTQVLGVVRSADFALTTGLEPKLTLEGRANRDMSGFKVTGPLAATLDLVLEFDSVGEARSYAAFRSNSNEFIRLATVGDVLGGSNYQVRIDGSYRFASPPALQADGDLNLVGISLEAVYDETGTAQLEFVVVNDLSAL